MTTAKMPLHRFATFVLVGTIGFIVDAGTLTSLITTGLSPFPARIISMLLATVVTWRLNRSFTFAPSNTSQASEGLRYVAVALTTLTLNYLTFVAALLTIPNLMPAIAVAIATAVSMWVSYVGYSLIAFRNRHHPVVFTGGTTEEPYTGVEELHVLANAHNYNRALGEMVQAASTPTDQALDFGAGIGSFSKLLMPHVEGLVCIEPDTHLNSILTSEGFQVVSSPDALSDASVDFAFTLNVIEHIEDDVAAIKQLERVLSPDGRLLIYVPALQYLYSGMDHAVGHWRRYSKSELVSKVESAGFDVESVRYADSLGVLATLIFKLFDSGSGDVNPKSIEIYDRWIFPISRFIDTVTGGVYGKNLVLRATKRRA